MSDRSGRETSAEAPGAAPPPWHPHAESCPVWVEAMARLGGRPLRRLRRVLHLDPPDPLGPALAAAATAGDGTEHWIVSEDPAEAAEARAWLALAAPQGGLAAEVIEADLPALAARKDLPPFDLIAVPELWDALDDPAREGFGRLLAERLAPGGALLMAHEVPPGGWMSQTWAQLLQLGWEQAEGGPDDPDRLRRALDAAEAAFQHSHMLVRQMGGWSRDVERFRALPLPRLRRHWLAGRGAAWPMRRLGAFMARAGLRAFATAEPFRLAPGLDFGPDQLAVIRAARDPWSAAERADLLAARRRRFDLFLRDGGPAPEPAAPLRLAALRPPHEVPDYAMGLSGPVALARAAHAPLMAAFAEAPVLTAERLGALTGLPAPALVERIAVLIGAGSLAPARHLSPDDAPAAARSACDALNAAVAASREAMRPRAVALLGGAAAAVAADDPTA